METELKHPPAIVLVTAFGRDEVREEAERLQLDGFLVKPVTHSMLVDTLVSVFIDSADSANAVIEATAEGVRLEGMRVLLAEDNEINQQIARELLEGVGACVTIASNGREAVDLLARDVMPPFDVVLMDLQMPEMSGYEATTKIRAESRFAGLPIIAMTAHATLDERQRCLAVGMNDHITKPIDPRLLFGTLSRFHTSGDGAPRLSAPQRSRAPSTVEIPAIAGLDTTDGLARVGGNPTLYLKLLRTFRDEQHAILAHVKGALAQGKDETAERAAHTLKGVAGNLGARAVQAAAGEVEKSIRERAPADTISAALAGLSAALDPLLAALDTAFPKTVTGAVTASPPTVVDAAATRAAIAQLAKLLAEFDAATVEFVEQNEPALRPAFTAHDWMQLTGHIRSFAFAEAEDVLRRIAK